MIIIISRCNFTLCIIFQVRYTGIHSALDGRIICIVHMPNTKMSVKGTQRKKRKRNHPENNRVARIHLFHHLIEFPYGGRLCGTHVKQVYSFIQTQQSLADELNTFSDIHSYQIEVDRHDELKKVNTLLVSLGQSPLKSQVTMPLDEQTPGAIRRVVCQVS